MSADSVASTSGIWAGQRLTSPIAVRLFTAAPTAAAHPIILFASVADSQNGRIVSIDRLAEFLTDQADCAFICEHSATFHWTIHNDADGLGNPTSIRDMLWRISAESRLLDVQLLEQLVRLASTGEEAPLHSLAELLPDWCQSAWEPPEQVARDAISLGDIRSFPPELVFRACEVARALWRLYNALSQAADAAARNSIGTTADSPYGPLGIGIQVQARIALEKPRPRPIVRDEGATDVIAWLEQEIERQTPNIQRCSRLRDCLQWEQDRIVFKSGYPKIDSARLETLLVSVAGELLGPDGVPFPYVTDANGKKSVHEQNWGILSQCDPHLRAWFQLSTSARQFGFIQKYRGQPIEVDYSIVPRIRTEPREAILNALISRGLLHRAEVGQHFALSFDELELRALASWCEHRFESSALAAAFRNGDNPIRILAERLTTNRRSSLQGDGQRMKAAELLLTAIGQKIGPANFRKMAELELNQNIGLQIAVDWEQAAFELFPELRNYQDDVADRLATNLQVPRTTIDQELQTCTGFAAIAAQILGRQPLGPAYDKLTDLISDPQLKFKAVYRQDHVSLYDKLFGRCSRLPSGRIRAHGVFAEGNAEYLDLADDALKAAIYAIAAAGFEIVAVAEGTLLVWAGDPIDSQKMIVNASAAATWLLGVPVEISRQRTW